MTPLLLLPKRYSKFRLQCIIVFCVSAILSAYHTKAQEAYTWSNVKIGGGGFVSGIITSKTEQNLMYIRTDVGGAYRWDHINNKWIPLLDWVSESELGYQGVESIAIDPVEPSNVYMLVGTSYFNNGKSAILRSSDYGNTFTSVDVTSQFKAHGNGMGRQSGEKLQVDPNSNNILYCGTRANGLFKSTTSGGTWNKLTSLTVPATNGSNGISFVIIDPASGSSGSPSQTIIAGMSLIGTNLYRSDDAGATFTAIAGAPASLMPHRAVLASDGNLYITYTNTAGPWDITGAGEMWKYNLQSGAWTNISVSGFTGAYGGISVDPANPNRLVASSLNSWWKQYTTGAQDVYGERIFLTTDGGTTWVDLVDRGFQVDPNGSPWINGHSIHWTGSVEFDPFDTKKAWIISGNGMFQTDNIDSTTNVWKFQVEGLEETVPLDIVSIANGPLVSVIGDYDGFTHYDVTEYAPIHMPRMGSTTGIASASLNPHVMVRVGEKMFYSENMGQSWIETDTINGVKGSVAINANGKVILHGPESNAKTYRSIDQGTTWTAVTGLNISGSRPVADPVNSDKFYAYNSGNGSLFVSIDGGISFTAAGSPGTGGSKVIRAAPYREGDLWVPLHNGGLSRSANSGETFSKIASVTQCGAVGFGKASPGTTYPTVFIWGTVGGVLGIHRSTDEGATWTRVNDNAHEYGGAANGQFVMGDMNVFGRVYMSTAGRGIVYGESSDTCIPSLITASIQVNGTTIEKYFVQVDEGADITFSPAAGVDGSWAWSGPGEFTAASSEVSFPDIQVSQSGIYTVIYTDANGCVSAPQTYTVDVIPPVIVAESITVTGDGNKTTIEEKDGTLQLSATVLPANTTDKSVVWSLSSGENFATVSSSGLVTALEDGVITVRATANDASGVFGELNVTISNQNVTAIGEPIDLSFDVSPNPTTRFLTVSHAAQVEEVIVFNIYGQPVQSQSNAKNIITLDLEDLANGLYIVQLKDHRNNRCVKRIVKN